MYVPFVTVSDKDFALSENVLRPHPHRNLSIDKRIFNCRLTRAGRMVECAFGILCNKRRIFHRAIDLFPDFADTVVMACCVRARFEDTLHKCPLENTESVHWNEKYYSWNSSERILYKVFNFSPDSMIMFEVWKHIINISIFLQIWPHSCTLIKRRPSSYLHIQYVTYRILT